MTLQTTLKIERANGWLGQFRWVLARDKDLLAV